MDSELLKIFQLLISSTTLIVLIGTIFKLGKWVQKKDSDIAVLMNRQDILENKLDILTDELVDIKTDVTVLKVTKHADT